MKIKINNKVLFIVFLHQHQELNHQHVGKTKFLNIIFFFINVWFTAVFLSPPSSSSSSASSTTTSLRIDCNIKTETMDKITSKNHHHHQQQALAITRAFDNLAKAAAHVTIIVFISLLKYC